MSMIPKKQLVLMAPSLAWESKFLLVFKEVLRTWFSNVNGLSSLHNLITCFTVRYHEHETKEGRALN